MKKILVYPSVIIPFKCPYCAVSGKIKGNSPPTKDFLFQCPKCTEKILVKLNIRNAYRKELKIDVFFSIFDFSTSNERNVQEGKIVDISKTGMSIKAIERRKPFSEDYEKEGSILYLLFTLPGKTKPLKVTGKIVNFRANTQSSIFKVGIKFFGLTEFQKQEIGFYLL